MDNKFKIILIILGIFLLIFLGFWGHGLYLNNKFEGDLIEAYGDYEKVDNLSQNVFKFVSNSYNFDNESLSECINTKKDLKIINDSISNELSSLKKAKNFTHKPEEREYLNLMIKLKENRKDYFELYNVYLDNSILMFKDNITIKEYTKREKANKIKHDKLENQYTQIIEDINYLLINHSNLREKLLNLGLRKEYIGVI